MQSAAFFISGHWHCGTQDEVLLLLKYPLKQVQPGLHFSSTQSYLAGNSETQVSGGHIFLQLVYVSYGPVHRSVIKKYKI